MSQLTILTELVRQAIQMLNNIQVNAKTLDELSAQTTLNSNSKIHVSIGGVSQYITVSQLMEAFANSNVNRLLFIGDIPPISGNTLIIPPAGWIIDGVNYSTTIDTEINIPYADTDKSRIDIIVADTLGVIYSIQGNETAGSIIVAQPLPDNTVYITQVLVTDSTIGDIEDPIVGLAFIKKIEKNKIPNTSSGVIDFEFIDERATVEFSGSVTTLRTVDINTYGIYENKKYTVKNHQLIPITIEHLSATGTGMFKFSFPNETDFILQPNEVVEFLPVKSPSPILEFIGKVNFEIENINGLQDALDDKLDVSAYNDRFKGKYTNLANLQLAHPTSNDGDYAIVDAGSGTDALEYIWDANEGWVKGNSTGAATTDALTEGSVNLYFQTARVLATLLTGLSLVTGGAIVSTDSILIAFGKLQKQVTDNLTAIGLKQDILTDVNFGSFINARTSKTTPVDADQIGLMDSADSNKLKKLSILNLKALIFGISATETITGVVNTTTQTFGGNKTIVGSGSTTGNALEVQNVSHASRFKVLNDGGVDIQAKSNTTGDKYITFGDGSGLETREVYFERVATSGGGFRIRTSAGVVVSIDGTVLSFTGVLNSTVGFIANSGYFTQGNSSFTHIIRTQITTSVFGFFAGASNSTPSSLTNLMYQIDTDNTTPANRQFSIPIPVKIGGITLNHASTIFQVESTTKGACPFPEMTQAQRLAISSPKVNLHVYQTDGTEGVYVNKSSGWVFAY